VFVGDANGQAGTSTSRWDRPGSSEHGLDLGFGWAVDRELRHAPGRIGCVGQALFNEAPLPPFRSGTGVSGIG
jgi:hypothetical protein